MEPLNLMVSLSFFGNKRDRADIASNRAPRTAGARSEASASSGSQPTADPQFGGAAAWSGTRRAGGARRAADGRRSTAVGARRVVRWLRTVGAR
jgi:hypothetical protein